MKNDEISFVVQKIGTEQKFQKLLEMLENALPKDYLLNAKLISNTNEGGDLGGKVVLTLSPEGLFQMNGLLWSINQYPFLRPRKFQMP